MRPQHLEVFGHLFLEVVRPRSLYLVWVQINEVY
jgi:hypothetical protein